MVKSPPPKGSAPATTEAAVEPVINETFTIGVSDVRFNTNQCYFWKTLRRTPAGKVVTLAFWQQKESVSDPSVPYYDKRSEKNLLFRKKLSYLNLPLKMVFFQLQ